MSPSGRTAPSPSSLLRCWVVPDRSRSLSAACFCRRRRPSQSGSVPPRVLSCHGERHPAEAEPPTWSHVSRPPARRPVTPTAHRRAVCISALHGRARRRDWNPEHEIRPHSVVDAGIRFASRSSGASPSFTPSCADRAMPGRRNWPRTLAALVVVGRSSFRSPSRSSSSPGHPGVAPVSDALIGR